LKWLEFIKEQMRGQKRDRKNGNTGGQARKIRAQIQCGGCVYGQT
jgi:hypothetical protein